MEELNENYVDGLQDLNGGNLGNFYFSCGVTKPIVIDAGRVVSKITYTDGVPDTQPDFATVDFDINDFSG
jgi:hypothetical protein